MKDAYYEALKDTRGTLFAEIQKEYASRYHFHRAYELAYIYEGSALYTVEDEELFAEKDHIVFAHRYYRHQSHDTHPHEKFVIAVPENLSQDVDALFSHSTLPHLLPDKEFNQTVFPFFKALYETDKNTSSITVKGYVGLIFGLLVSHYKSITVTPKSKNVSLIAEILSYIDKHADEPLHLSQIAKEFGYNKSYFSRLFNGYVGVSLNRYINYLRLDRFEKLAKENKNASITDLVFKAGFPSLATFYRAKRDRELDR